MNGRAKSGGVVLWIILIAIIIGGFIAGAHGIASSGPADCPAGPYC